MTVLSYAVCCGRRAAGLKHMMSERLDWWDLDLKPGSSTYADENWEGKTMATKEEGTRFFFEKKLQDLGIYLYTDVEIAGKFGRTCGESSLCLVDTCKHKKAGKRYRGGYKQSDGGASLQRFHLWARKLVMKWSALERTKG